MASQRITIATIGGAAAEVILLRLREWAQSRSTSDPKEWSNDQWPASTRNELDRFADKLRAHGCLLPAINFVEWADLWLMGDVFIDRLSPRGGPSPIIAHGNRFEVYCYTLPDGGHLARHLEAAGKQQLPEYDWLINRLCEAANLPDGLVDSAVLIVLRDVIGGLVTDEELKASMSLVPSWLCED